MNHYELLEVAPNASAEEIRRAWRRAARRYSPDYNPSPDASHYMVQVNDAREVLLDATKRADYDRALRRNHGKHAADAAGGADRGAHEDERTIRVRPAHSDLGVLFGGDRRVIEIEVFVIGPEPSDIGVAPEAGEGWQVDEVEIPNDDSGRYLIVRLGVAPAPDDPAGTHEAFLDLTFDGDAIRMTFRWEVAHLTPPTPPPPPPRPQPAPSPTPPSPPAYAASAPPTPSAFSPSSYATAPAAPHIAAQTSQPVIRSKARRDYSNVALRLFVIAWVCFILFLDWRIMDYYQGVTGYTDFAHILGYSLIPLIFADVGLVIGGVIVCVALFLIWAFIEAVVRLFTQP